MLKFNNTDVAKKYKSGFKSNPVVHLPGKKATGFKCNLADITPDQADKLFAVKNQNLLELNTSIPAVEEKAGKKDKDIKPS
jgi:hypothetical protein